MAVNTAAGSTMYISTQAVAASVDWRDDSDEDIIEAMTDESVVWTEIGWLEDLGEIGDEASEITGTALSQRRVMKFKGTYDAGTVAAVAFSDPEDAGQQAMIAAFETDFDYPFRVVLNDALTEAGGPTNLFFAGKVMSKRRNIGNVENIVRQSYPVGINTRIVEDPAT